MGDFVNKLVLTAVSVATFAKQDRMKAGSVYIAVIGGVLTYAAEFLFLRLAVNLFLVYFLAAGVTCLYSEIMARIMKMPATVLMLPAIIPLVPGSLLYFAMRGLLTNDYGMYKEKIIEALLAAAGIAAAAAISGILAGWYSRVFHHIDSKK